MFRKYAKLSGFLSLASISVLLLVLSACGSSSGSSNEVKNKVDGTTYSFSGITSAKTGTVILGTNGATIENHGTISQNDSSSAIVTNSLKALDTQEPSNLTALSLNPDEKLEKIFQAIKVDGGSKAFNYGTISASGSDFFSTSDESPLIGIYADNHSSATNAKEKTINFNSSLSKDMNPNKIFDDSKNPFKPFLSFSAMPMMANNYSNITNNGTIINDSQFGIGMSATNNSKAINNGTISHIQKNYNFNLTTKEGYDKIKYDTEINNFLYISMNASGNSTIVNNGAIKISIDNAGITNDKNKDSTFIFMYAENSHIINNKNISFAWNNTIPRGNAFENTIILTKGNSTIENHGNITVSNAKYTQVDGIIAGDDNSTVLNTGNINVINSNVEAVISGSSNTFNSGNITISDSNNTIGIEQEDNGNITNTGTITISSDSTNSCGIKMDSSLSANIKNMGTIIVNGTTYTDKTKAWSAPADAKGNKPICH